MCGGSAVIGSVQARPVWGRGGRTDPQVLLGYTDASLARSLTVSSSYKLMSMQVEAGQPRGCGPL